MPKEDGQQPSVSTIVVENGEQPVAVLARGTKKGQSLCLTKLFARAGTGKKKNLCQVTTLIDNGSTATIVREEIARRLEARLKMGNVTISTIGGPNHQKMAMLELEVSPNGREWFKVSEALTTKNFSFGDTKLQWFEYIKKDPVFEGTNVDDYDYGEINLLIGNDMEEYFLPLDGEENRRRNKNGVLALKTQLGWTIAGPLRAATAPTKYNCYTMIVNASTVVFEQEEEVSIAAERRRLNDVDALGIEPKKTAMSRKEEREQAALDKSTFWENGRITVQMLWKGEFVYIPPSKAAARRRLKLLNKKLSAATLSV
jgi:hypothetical protein